jgi:hypothetical protein
MTRRSLLAAAASAFALDPETLLWRRGAKTISVPAARVAYAYKEGGHVFIRLPQRYRVQGGGLFSPTINVAAFYDLHFGSGTVLSPHAASPQVLQRRRA